MKKISATFNPPNDTPSVPLDEHGGRVRVIAGDYQGHLGPAKTFTPINMWDVRLSADSDVSLPVPDGHTTLVVVLEGTVQINDSDLLRNAEIACFEREGSAIRLEANREARLLVLTGEPIDEPVIGHGSFVMNTVEEINQAITDFHSSKFGALHE